MNPRPFQSRRESLAPMVPIVPIVVAVPPAVAVVIIPVMIYKTTGQG